MKSKIEVIKSDAGLAVYINNLKVAGKPSSLNQTVILEETVRNRDMIDVLYIPRED